MTPPFAVPAQPAAQPPGLAAPAPAAKPKLERFTRKKKQAAFDEINDLMAEGRELGVGLEYLYDWLHAELQKAK